MTILKYGFLGEDEAHRIFLTNYLEKLISFDSTRHFSFQFDEEFSWRFKGGNKKEVDSLFAEAAAEGYTEYKHDIFFVGRDLDTFKDNEYQKKYSYLQSKLYSNFQDKTFFLLPVQCIEHWLWYIKLHCENPISTKNITLENHPNKEVKAKLYGNAKASNRISLPIVEDLSKKLDIDFLESRSKSFNHFHQQVKSFIENY